MNLKLIIIIFTLWFIVLGSFNIAKAQQYSIQVKSYPIAEKDSALQLYNDLKNSGYFVYMHTSKIGPNLWIRIKIGYFYSIEEAKKIGDKVKLNTGLNYWVNSGYVLIDNSKTNYNVLTTPTGIWIEENSNFEEVYSFLPHIYQEDIPLETKPMISPVSDEIVFYDSHKIIKVNLKNKKVVILKEADSIEGLNKSFPKWSYDGKYIAYMDSYTWEIPTRLWVMQNDGSCDKCLVQDLTMQNKVKDFSWHPTSYEIFFIYGFTYGAMDLGGNLYSINVETHKSRMIAGTTNKSKFLVEKFQIADNEIFLTIMELDNGAPLGRRIIKKIPLSVISHTLELREVDLR